MKSSTTCPKCDGADVQRPSGVRLDECENCGHAWDETDRLRAENAAMRAVVELARVYRSAMSNRDAFDEIAERMIAVDDRTWGEALTVYGEGIAYDWHEKGPGDLHHACDVLREHIAAALRSAVAAEREACARIADQCVNDEGPHSIGVWVAEQIRARGGVQG